MDDFTQRLLEKKNARKRKQEEASFALRNIDVSSEKKKSPVKRNPLVEKNEQSREYQRNPKPTPRSDILSKNEMGQKGKYARETGKMTSSENRKNESLTYGRRENGVSSSRVANAGNESIQERMQRLRSQSSSFDDDIVENKKKRNVTNDTARTADAQIKNNKFERSSGSVSERLAMFETQNSGPQDKSRSTSNKASPVAKPTNTSVSDYESRHRQAGKVKKTSTKKYSNPCLPQRINIDNIIDESGSLDFDSDENPFDVSAILKEADKAEQRENQKDEVAKPAWSVDAYLTNDSPQFNKKAPENKRESVYSVDGNGEEPSEFAKQIAKKQKAIKSPTQQASLSKIEKKVNKTPLKVDDAAINDITEVKREKQLKIKTKQHGLNHHDREDKHQEGEVKRKAPRHPSQEEPAKLKKKTSGLIKASDTADEVRCNEARDDKRPPPKPARKNKDIKEFEAKIEADTEMHVLEKAHVASVEKRREGRNEKKPVVLEKGQDGKAERQKEKAVPEKGTDGREKKEERKRRARDEPRRDNPEDFETREVLKSKPEEKRRAPNPGLSEEKRRAPNPELEDAAKRMKHVQEVTPKAEVPHRNPTLPEIDECESLRSFDSPMDKTDLIFSPNSKSYKSVREKKSAKPRKTMRRSMSFSEGQLPQMTMHKSGYNEEASSKYNVVTTCVATEEDKMSNSEKIKDLLDYAVSQQNIVIQASQALNMGLQGEDRRGSPEIVEGERLLLLATERRTACLEEVENLKHGDPNVISSASGYSQQNGSCPPCKADLIISDIKLPLNGDFLLALRSGRMDFGVFHFVVLIQYGPKQIYSTKARCTYDELSRNYLTFAEKIEIKNVSHDFLLTVKVFGMHTKRGSDPIPRGKKQQPTKDSPGLMKNVFSRRRVNSADDSPVRGSSPKPVFRTTSFTPCGNTNVNLKLVKYGKHALTKVPKNCPLEGFVELNLDCQPRFTASARGFLTILEEVGEYTAWNRRWSVMQGDSISFWRFPDEETSKPSVGSIDLTNCVSKSVDVIPRMECSRPNTFELIVKRPVAKNDVPSLLSTIEGNEVHIKYWVSADNKDDRIAWIETLNRQLSDSKAWSVCKPRTKVYQPRSKDVNSSQGNRGAVAV